METEPQLLFLSQVTRSFVSSPANSLVSYRRLLMAPQPKTALYDDGSDDEAPQFGVNKTFAAAYTTKKQTEELSKRACSSSYT